MFAILLAGALVFGPTNWDPQAFQQAMNTQTVSLPAAVPSGEIDVGGYQIVPVTVIQPAYDSTTQQLIAGSPVVSGSTVTVIYSVAPLPPPGAEQIYASRVSAGITISCTASATVCTPSITGTYRIDPASQADIAVNRLSILADGVMSNGQATMPWSDQSGAFHPMTIPQFNEFATAAKQYVAALKLAVLTAQQGGTPTWPSASIQIP